MLTYEGKEYPFKVLAYRSLTSALTRPRRRARVTTSLKDFINSGWDFGEKAQASAVVQQQGGTFAGAISVAPGVWVYRLTETGLSAELTVTGTKYHKDSDLH